jgi:hypothetical protein
MRDDSLRLPMEGEPIAGATTTENVVTLLPPSAASTYPRPRNHSAPAPVTSCGDVKELMMPKKTPLMRTADDWLVTIFDDCAAGLPPKLGDLSELSENAREEVLDGACEDCDRLSHVITGIQQAMVHAIATRLMRRELEASA